jgi:hypothetical protein
LFSGLKASGFFSLAIVVSINIAKKETIIKPITMYLIFYLLKVVFMIFTIEIGIHKGQLNAIK